MEHADGMMQKTRTAQILVEVSHRALARGNLQADMLNENFQCSDSYELWVGTQYPEFSSVVMPDFVNGEPEINERSERGLF